MLPSPSSRVALGLALTPVLVAAAGPLAPRVALAEGTAYALAFVCAVTVTALGVALAASGDVSGRVQGALVAAATATLGALGVVGVRGLGGALAVDAALVVVGWGVGTAIGRRVEHAGHLLPATVVAASADVVSIVSPHGVTHAIVRSERALSLLAVSFPLAGTTEIAPALGAGDLVFIGVVLGAARAHALPYARAVALCIVGALAAGGLSFALQAEVPALPTIGAAVIVGLPAARRLRRRDLTTATAAIALSLTLAAATLASRFGWPTGTRVESGAP